MLESEPINLPHAPPHDSHRNHRRTSYHVPATEPSNTNRPDIYDAFWSVTDKVKTLTRPRSFLFGDQSVRKLRASVIQLHLYLYYLYRIIRRSNATDERIYSCLSIYRYVSIYRYISIDRYACTRGWNDAAALDQTTKHMFFDAGRI